MLIISLLKSIQNALNRQISRRQLKQLSNDALRDMGISQENMRTEIAKLGLKHFFKDVLISLRAYTK